MVSGTARAARCLLPFSSNSRGFAANAAARAVPVAYFAPLSSSRPRPSVIRPPLLPSSSSSRLFPPLPISPSPPLSFVPRSLKDAIESFPSRDGFSDEEPLPEALDPAPSKQVLSLWAKSDVVCFDIDCTVTTDDSLDLLARFLGKGEAVAELTSAAMEGLMPLEEALRKRLEILDVTPSDLARFHEAFPARDRLTLGSKELITALTERGTRVYLISGGFRELALPVARALGVSADRLFANRMNFQLRDGPESGGSSGDGGANSVSDGEEWGTQLRVAGFDPKEEVSANGGKPKAIKKIRASLPYR